MARQSKLKYVALGITTHCSHHCDICYETANLRPFERRHGDMKTLLQICDKLVEAGVEFVELVGGDPAAHPGIVALVHYLQDSGIKVGMLSNTHQSWREVSPYVSSLEWTVHGRQSYHDAYTRPGTYNEVLNRLKSFADSKREDQQIAITVNFTPVMATSLYDTARELTQELPIDYIQLQRVGPFGGAASGLHALRLDEIIAIFRQIQRLDEELKIAIEVVDSYPMCLLPVDLQRYTARCDLGFGTAYIDMRGNLSRCAVNQRPLGNILDPKTSLEKIWAEHPDLIKFREKKYLPSRCQKCDLLEQCGGGCPSSCGGCDLSADELMIRSGLA